MGLHDPFDHLQHKLFAKIKVRSWSDNLIPDHKKLRTILKYVHISGVPHIVEKFSTKATTCFKPRLNWSSSQEVIDLQSVKSSNFKISRLPSWEFRGKWYLGAAPMANHRKYYKGEGGGFPQVWVMGSLVCPCMFMIRSCTKSVPTMH
jgi:hypothetical protein